MNNRQSEERKPRKRFLVRKAAELVRSVKATGNVATYEITNAANRAANRFNDLFSNPRPQVQ